jgi:hypothetical protein
MPQQRLYYEYVDKLLIPYVYVLTFQSHELRWDKPVYFYGAIAPINYVGIEEFDDSLNNSVIYYSDFIFQEHNPTRFGLNLTKIKVRIESHNVDPYVINQLILHNQDISKVMSMIPGENKMEFILMK